MRRTSALITATMFVIAACGADDDGSPSTINVPGDEPTIQAAVDAADPGDLVLIAPGTYNEGVIVETDDITIRGLDRNEVVLDGGDELFDGFLVVSDGVAVENLTVTRFVQNGVIFTGRAAYDPGDGSDVVDVADAVENPEGTLERYRISHVTAANNGTYGIYAFASTDGVIVDTYASGHPDSGFYIGQCKPCDVFLHRVTAERNSIGYFGTNASGGVVITRSVFRNNRLGLTPNSQEAERLAPQVGATIVGNLVVDNDDPEAPAIANGFFGGGIAVGGGTDNVIARNRVEGHDGFGIGLIPLDGFAARDNRIEGNVVVDNGIDLVVDTGGEALGNCFDSNDVTTQQPEGVAEALRCGDDPAPFEAQVFTSPPAPPAIDYRTVAPPGGQRTMIDPASPRVPAGTADFVVDLGTLGVPD